MKGNTINKVEATGKVIWTGKDKHGYSVVRILIRGRKPAVVQFAVSQLDPTISIGSNITVSGYVKAYSYQDEIHNKWRMVQYFVATDIRKNETEIMQVFGVQGRYFKETVFRAYIRGDVSYAMDTKDPNWGKLTVRVDGVGGDQRPSYIQMSYHKDRFLPPFDYRKGDEVCIVASISTTEKEFEGQSVYFENLIIEDIVRVGRAENDPADSGAETPAKAEDDVDPVV